MARKRKKCDAENLKNPESQKKVELEEPDSLDDLIAQLPEFPEEHVPLEHVRALVEKVAVLETARIIDTVLMMEQKKIIETKYWRIGKLEKQLQWQREENLRIEKKLHTDRQMMQEEMKKVEEEKTAVEFIEAERKMLKDKEEMEERLKLEIEEKQRVISENCQKDAKTLEKQEQMRNSHAEQLKTIKNESDKKYNDLLSVHRNETNALEAAKIRLIGEKNALIDQKSAIETLLKNEKMQRKREMDLMAEKKKIFKTNQSKIDNLEKQLNLQRNDSRIISEIQEEHRLELKDRDKEHKSDVELLWLVVTKFKNKYPNIELEYSDYAGYNDSSLSKVLGEFEWLSKNPKTESIFWRPSEWAASLQAQYKCLIHWLSEKTQNPDKPKTIFWRLMSRSWCMVCKPITWVTSLRARYRYLIYFGVFVLFVLFAGLNIGGDSEEEVYHFYESSPRYVTPQRFSGHDFLWFR